MHEYSGHTLISVVVILTQMNCNRVLLYLPKVLVYISKIASKFMNGKNLVMNVELLKMVTNCTTYVTMITRILQVVWYRIL